MKDGAYLKESLLAKLPPVWERRMASKKNESTKVSAPAPAPVAAPPAADPAVKSEPTPLAKSGRFGALAAMMDAEVSQMTKGADQK